MSLFNLFGPGKTTALPREGTIKLPLDLSVHNVYSILKETKIFGKLLLYFSHCCVIPPEPIFVHLSLCPTSIPYVITPPTRRVWRSFKFAPFLFFFPVSKVGLPLMGDTAVQYTDCYLRF